MSAANELTASANAHAGERDRRRSVIGRRSNVVQGSVAERRYTGINATSLPPSVTETRLGERSLLIDRLDLDQVRADALAFCLVLLGYFLGAVAALELITVAGVGAVVVAPAGVSSAAILMTSTRRWPAILTAVAIGEVLADILFAELSPWSIFGFVAANTLAPLVGGVIVRRLVPSIDLSRRLDLKAFLLGAVSFGPMVGGVIGATTIALAGGPFWRSFVSWWLGNAVGVVLIGSLILGLLTMRRAWSSGSVDILARLGLTTALAIAVYWITDLPIGVVVIIPIAGIAARNGTWMTTIATNVVAVIAVGALLVDKGELAGLSVWSGTMVVKTQLLCVAVTALLIAAEASERESLSRESGYQIETVRQLRNALAPESVIRTAHVEAEGISHSASERLEVGGDWYDIFEGDNGEVSIVIGDVVGHGEHAVVGMGKMRSAAAALAQRTSDTGQVLDWLDEFARSMHDRPYATAFFGRFDPNQKLLTYSTAGHPPALISKDDGSWEWLFGGRSTPIGVPFPKARPSSTVQLDGPCTLIVYTDGAVERAGEVIDTGLARVYDAVTRRPDASVDQLLHEVTEETVRDDASFVRVRLRC